MALTKRKLPIGAEITQQGVNFRVYAPLCQQVQVSLEEKPVEFKTFPLSADDEKGYFSGTFKEFKAGSLYRFKLDNHTTLYPDPASRYQPFGPFGPSQVVDPLSYSWKDKKWKGVQIEGQIIYEMHIGTFTQEGTLAAAQKELEELANLGITTIELMPLHEFPGKFGWGYDGVNIFAPTRLYGNPDDLRKFIDAAHQLGIAVIHDVVYNHFGPEGNFISFFSDSFFLEHDTEWGRAINFDNKETREFFLSNVKYWIDEFHFDGLRIDATQSIHSTTPVHILLEIQQTARHAAPDRSIIVVGENEQQHSIIFRPEKEGGYGFDALWNDDFHHSALVCLTGRREAYYTDYKGSAQELISCIKHGFLFQGQYYVWQEKQRGTPCLDIKPSSFILFLQNHDQVANSGHSQRIHHLTDPGNLKTMTCFLLLAPNTPMLFQGQEFCASTPFYYFADHSDDLTKAIFGGRKEFLSQFENLATEEMQARLTNPGHVSSFIKSKLNFSERETNKFMYQLHKDLIQIRKTDPVLSKSTHTIDGAVLDKNTAAIRFFDPQGDRLLLFNFGIDIHLNPASEPLLAPLEECAWEILWSSESPAYGGQGVPPLENDSSWKILGHCAYLLVPKK